MNKKKAFLRKLGRTLVRMKEHSRAQKDFSVLFFSCLVFLTNALAAYSKNQFIYSILFVTLTGTSLIVHSYDILYTNLLDKCSVALVILYGGNLLYNTIQSIDVSIYTILIMSKIFITFLITLYIYIVGYYTRSFCFHPQTSVSQQYHMALHCISSIGHHCILFL